MFKIFKNSLRMW